ncbi:MAG: quinolinate synthase NadA [Bacteroidales bacterium]|jgi:quinolinate synthase|nr:quinolinate synthase NadA [Bacteroidales bacterium]
MIYKNEDFKNFGFLKIEISKEIKDNLVNEILKLKKEKEAIILAHYYVRDEIQKIADIVGDSLQLSIEASKTNAKIILFAGVNFMAETAKILSPAKKVLLPDLNAGCSLADSCPTEDFKKFLEKHPNHTVISYVNTTAEIKALSDIIVTSSNAVKIVNSLSKDEKIIFGPDKNLGDYVNSKTGKNMILWNGACHVHKRFDLNAILNLKKLFPTAKIIAHPECEKPIILIADFIGSTAALLKFTKTDNSDTFIVVTESGILFKMKELCPDKTFITAPPTDENCSCNDCSYMKLNTLEKIYLCLKYELPEIQLDINLIKVAKKSLDRMLELS